MLEAKDGMLFVPHALAIRFKYRRLENKQFERAVTAQRNSFQAVKPEELLNRLVRFRSANTYQVLLELNWLDIAAQYLAFESELRATRPEKLFQMTQYRSVYYRY
jgi:hypothetical protein